MKRKPLFYQSLSLFSLKCLLNGILQNRSQLLRDYLTGTITLGLVSALSWIFLNVQTTPTNSESSSKFLSVSEFSCIVSQLLESLVDSEAISFEDHDPLMRDLGLLPGCWLLFIIPSSLSLLASVLVIRAARNNDDPLCVNIHGEGEFTGIYCILLRYTGIF